MLLKSIRDDNSLLQSSRIVRPRRHKSHPIGIYCPTYVRSADRAAHRTHTVSRAHARAALRIAATMWTALVVLGNGELRTVKNARRRATSSSPRTAQRRAVEP